jgi:hypothetical protein
MFVQEFNVKECVGFRKSGNLITTFFKWSEATFIKTKASHMQVKQKLRVSPPLNEPLYTRPIRTVV